MIKQNSVARANAQMLLYRDMQWLNTLNASLIYKFKLIIFERKKKKRNIKETTVWTLRIQE